METTMAYTADMAIENVRKIARAHRIALRKSGALTDAIEEAIDAVFDSACDEIRAAVEAATPRTDNGRTSEDDDAYEGFCDGIAARRDEDPRYGEDDGFLPARPRTD